MLLQINLLPGGRRGTARKGHIDFAKLRTFRGAKDPWLVAASLSVVAAIATVGLLFSSQNARAEEITTRLDMAVKDSTRYAKVLEARRRLTAERDSVHRQLQIIRSIDDNRYNWAHILDEVSRALPAYTWLTLLEQTSAPPVPPGTDTTAVGGAVSGPVAAAGAPVPTEGAAARRRAREQGPDSTLVSPTLTFRLVGQTVDIQALTMFMRQLESSPFIQHVALTKSEIATVDGKDITQFELTADYEVPPSGVVKTAPLIVPVR